MSGNDNDQKKGFFDKPLSRRDILKLAGVGGAGLLLGAGGVGGIVAAQASKTEKAFSASGAETDPQGTVPFYGGHQAGIVTPVQDFICFAAFDVTASSLAEVRKLFQAWTAAAANMAQGKMVGQDDGNELLPPSDTGEAAGLTSSRTTITFGPGRRSSTAASVSRAKSPRPSRICRLSAATSCGRNGAAAICACRCAPTICRSRSTRSAIWHASHGARPSSAGRRKASSGRDIRTRPKRHRAT